MYTLCFGENLDDFFSSSEISSNFDRKCTSGFYDKMMTSTLN
jgi:hypothetical protein